MPAFTPRNDGTCMSEILTDTSSRALMRSHAYLFSPFNSYRKRVQFGGVGHVRQRALCVVGGHVQRRCISSVREELGY